MTAQLTGIFAVRARLYSVLILFLLAGPEHAAGEDLARMQALQTLAIQIKHAVDKADTGSSPAAASVAQFEHALAVFHDASSSSSDLRFKRKYQAVALLFGKLKYQASHPSAKPAALTRAQMDIEVVTNRHGGTCETALGISEAMPVTTTLAQPGHGKSDVWLRFEPSNARHIRLTTDSNGADPAIEIFNSCGPGTTSIAANDDSVGLDARVAVASDDRHPMLVHVTNSGPAGSVTIVIAGTSASITGTVTDASTGLPVSDVQVATICNNFFCGDSTFTDQNGTYSLSIAAGTYYVRVLPIHYVSELYPNVPCLPGYNGFSTDGCAIAQALTVTVANGTTVPNINFALSPGHEILGGIRDLSNRPISSVDITLFNDSGTQVESVYSDNAGHYSFTTLPDSIYKLSAQAGGYGSQMFNHVPCGGPLQSQCDLTQAKPITISGQDVFGVNFDLTVLASIQGTVTGIGGLLPQDSGVVEAFDLNGNLAAQATLDANGHYTAGPLAPGNYHVFANFYGYFSQAFSGIDCVEQYCSAELANATSIAITQVNQQAQADFQLHPLPATHGHIQDSVSGLPLANVAVTISVTPPASFNAFSTVYTDNNGDYALDNVPAGTYYVWALSNDHVDQIYSGIACEAYNTYYYPGTAACDVTGATLLTITPGQNPALFNFSLNASSSISGTAITRAGAGSDLPAAVQVFAYDSSGIIVGSALTDALGHYIIGDLAPGTNYFAAAQNYGNPQFLQQFWQQIDCPNICAPTTSTPIVLAQGSNTNGIDFLMTRLDAIVGRVTNALGTPISGAVVDLFDASSGNYRGAGVADAQGFFAAGGYLGNSYFVATEAGPGYVDQVYSGISCPLGPAYYGLCALTNATAVGLGNTTSSQPHIVNFVLQSNDPIFANGFE